MIEGTYGTPSGRYYHHHFGETILQSITLFVDRHGTQEFPLRRDGIKGNEACRSEPGSQACSILAIRKHSAYILQSFTEVNTMRTQLFILLLSALTFACSSFTDGLTEVRLGKEFDLKLGQSAIIPDADLVITFKSIAEDSRCPTGAVCISAGNAKVVVSVSETNAPLNTTEGPKQISLRGYTVQLVAVNPYPKLDEEHPPRDYSIKLVATRQ